jgi:hypothetical protein
LNKSTATIIVPNLGLVCDAHSLLFDAKNGHTHLHRARLSSGGEAMNLHLMFRKARRTCR